MVGMFQRDLQKAFDTVDHSILHMKLKVCGLGNNILCWSYLSGRTHEHSWSVWDTFFQLSCNMWRFTRLHFRTADILIYINDMSDVVKICKLLLYGMILESWSLAITRDIELLLSGDLESLSKWLSEINYHIILAKLNAFSLWHLIKSRVIQIACDNTTIISTTSVKYIN